MITRKQWNTARLIIIDGKVVKSAHTDTTAIHHVMPHHSCLHCMLVEAYDRWGKEELRRSETDRLCSNRVTNDVLEWLADFIASAPDTEMRARIRDFIIAKLPESIEENVKARAAGTIRVIGQKLN